ncbi:unnamed protein product [Arctogadus glacialis]
MWFEPRRGQEPCRRVACRTSLWKTWTPSHPTPGCSDPCLRCVPISTPNRWFDRLDRTNSRSEVPAGAGTGPGCGGQKGAPRAEPR